MKRTVFFFPDLPRRDWRVAIAIIGVGPATPIPHNIDNRWCGDVPRILCALGAGVDFADLDGTQLPASVGPSCELGDLVRLIHPDGTEVDLDEETRVAWGPLWDARGAPRPCYKLMCLEADDGPNGSAYFHHGPRALPMVPLSKARGGYALLPPVVGDAPWSRVTVESWEDEARRLRRELERKGATS